MPGAGRSLPVGSLQPRHAQHWDADLHLPGRSLHFRYRSAHRALGGANDFLNAGQTNAAVPVANLSSIITTLANAGAENILVPNLPLLGRVPRHVGTANEAPFNARTLQFNNLLASELDVLEASLGITIFRVDTFSLFQQIDRSGVIRLHECDRHGVERPGRWGGVGCGRPESG